MDGRVMWMVLRTSHMVWGSQGDNETLLLDIRNGGRREGTEGKFGNTVPKQRSRIGTRV